MPVRFWGDPENAYYRDTYFTERPGLWTHGDLLEFTRSGGLVISGRSDATLKRGGVRIGTAEIYRVVEGLSVVTDSLIVHHEDGDRLILFLAVDGPIDDREIAIEVKRLLKERLSPRHVPNEVYVVSAIPTTLSGKKLEVPVKKILAGANPNDVASRGSLRNPAALDAIVEVASLRKRRLRWDEVSRVFAVDGEAPRRVSARREELLEIAAELFARQGFAGVTVHDLGAAAGVSGPALYHHFDSKEAMLGEMLVGTTHHLLAAARSLLHLPPDELLDELIAIHVDFAVDHRALVSIQHRDLNEASADDQDRVRANQQQYFDIWVDAIIGLHPHLSAKLALPLVHAVLGLVNSTPSSPLANRIEMASLLRRMAKGAIDSSVEPRAPAGIRSSPAIAAQAEHAPTVIAEVLRSDPRLGEQSATAIAAIVAAAYDNLKRVD